MARQERMVNPQRGLGRCVPQALALDDRRRRMHVVEQRGIRDKAFLAHQLLGVQVASRITEPDVTLTWYLPDRPVVRHFVSLDVCACSHLTASTPGSAQASPAGCDAPTAGFLPHACSTARS